MNSIPKIETSSAPEAPERQLDSVEQWVTSIELPDDTGSWVDSIELPDDSGGWQEGIDLDSNLNRALIQSVTTSAEDDDQGDKPHESQTLSEEEKIKIKEETGWSDEIVDVIQNMKQYEILTSAGLIEVEINGRKCLVKENIDLDYKDARGRTNRQRIEDGLSPIDSKTRKPLELHHLGQKADSPLVELTVEEHRTGEYEDGKKNQSLWHDNSVETEVHGEGNTWNQEREAHWNARLEQLNGGIKNERNNPDN